MGREGDLERQKVGFIYLFFTNKNNLKKFKAGFKCAFETSSLYEPYR